jgi:hypothetical protein
MKSSINILTRKSASYLYFFIANSAIYSDADAKTIGRGGDVQREESAVVVDAGCGLA